LINVSPDKEVICRRPGPNLIGCEMTVERSSPGRMKWGYVISEEASTIGVSSAMMLINQKVSLKFEITYYNFFTKIKKLFQDIWTRSGHVIDGMMICYIAKIRSSTHSLFSSIYAYCRVGRFPRLYGLSP
jgi:hypothetical protein